MNATNQAGVTALMRAATSEEKTRLLVAKGADVKARSAHGQHRAHPGGPQGRGTAAR